MRFYPDFTNSLSPNSVNWRSQSLGRRSIQRFSISIPSLPASMDKQELKFIELITNLPPDVNPYLATASLIETSVHAPRSPLWSRRLRIALLVCMQLVLFQSLFLLYQRLQISQRLKITFDNLGLIVINVSLTSAVCYFLYSALTIYTLVIQIALDMGHMMDESMMLLIFGIKFLTVIAGAWALIWVCACQCARIFWHSTFASNLNRKVLKVAITWSLTLFFLCCAFGPLPFITWAYAKAYIHLKEIESISHRLTSALRSEASQYDPLHFSQMRLLTMLIPARKMLSLREVMENALRMGQDLYLAIICIMSLIYVPLLTISLRGLYKQSVSQAAIDAAARSDCQPKRSRTSVRIHRQRQRLAFHAFSAYLGTSVHLPVLICENLISRSPGFSHTMAWHELTFQGLTIPLAFIGNILLVILNLHAHMILQDRAYIEKSPNVSAKTETAIRTQSALNWFRKAGIFARELENFEENSFPLDDLEPNGKRRNPAGPGIFITQLTSLATVD